LQFCVKWSHKSMGIVAKKFDDFWRKKWMLYDCLVNDSASFLMADHLSSIKLFAKI
jgi:hypothetical protein